MRAILILLLSAGVAFGQGAARKIMGQPAPGSGGTAQITLDLFSVNFGTVPLGSYLETNIVVGNTGTAALNGSVTSSGQDAASFTTTAGSPYSIGIGGTAPVTIRYTPSHLGTHWGYANFSGGGGAAAYLLGYASRAENFEAPGYQLTWTEAGQTRPTETYPSAGMGMEGSYVCRRAVNNKTGYTRHTFSSALSYVYGYFMYRWESGSGEIISFRDASGNALATVSINASRQLALAMPGATTATCTTAISGGSAVTVHVWWSYMGGANGNVAWNTTAAHPGTGSSGYYREITSSSATANAALIQYGNTASSTITDNIDKLRYSMNGFLSNPL